MIRKSKQEMKAINKLPIATMNGSSENNASFSRDFIAFILMTFSHAETRNIEKEKLIVGIQKCLPKAMAIIIAKEKHATEGFHYHAAVQALTTKKDKYIKKLRNEFPQFDGAQLDVQTILGLPCVNMF